MSNNKKRRLSEAPERGSEKLWTGGKRSQSGGSRLPSDVQSRDTQMENRPSRGTHRIFSPAGILPPRSNKQSNNQSTTHSLKQNGSVFKGDLAIESEEDQVQHKENKRSGKMFQNTLKRMSAVINSSDENFDPNLWSHLKYTDEYGKEAEDNQQKKMKDSAKRKRRTSEQRVLDVESSDEETGTHVSKKSSSMKTPQRKESSNEVPPLGVPRRKGSSSEVPPPGVPRRKGSSNEVPQRNGSLNEVPHKKRSSIPEKKGSPNEKPYSSDDDSECVENNNNRTAPDCWQNKSLRHKRTRQLKKSFERAMQYDADDDEIETDDKQMGSDLADWAVKSNITYDALHDLFCTLRRDGSFELPSTSSAVIKVLLHEVQDLRQQVKDLKEDQKVNTDKLVQVEIAMKKTSDAVSVGTMTSGHDKEVHEVLENCTDNRDHGTLSQIQNQSSEASETKSEESVNHAKAVSSESDSDSEGSLKHKKRTIHQRTANHELTATNGTAHYDTNDTTEWFAIGGCPGVVVKHIKHNRTVDRERKTDHQEAEIFKGNKDHEKSSERRRTADHESSSHHGKRQNLKTNRINERATDCEGTAYLDTASHLKKAKDLLVSDQNKSHHKKTKDSKRAKHHEETTDFEKTPRSDGTRDPFTLDNNMIPVHKIPVCKISSVHSIDPDNTIAQTVKVDPDSSHTLFDTGARSSSRSRYAIDAEEEEFDNFFNDPVQWNTVEELEAGCEKMTKNKKYRKAMVKYLSLIGGRNLGDWLRRMMRRIMTTSLMSRYSLRGRPGKRAFDQLSIHHILVKIMMNEKNKGDYEFDRSKKAIEEKIMVILSGAAQTVKQEQNQRPTLVKQEVKK